MSARNAFLNSFNGVSMTCPFSRRIPRTERQRGAAGEKVLQAIRQGLDSKTRWTRGLATGPGAQELPYLGQVRVAGAGELQQKGPVMTSARQVEYSPIPSQSVCPRHARNVTASVLPYSHKTGPKMGCNTLKPVKILRISFPQPHFFRRQSDSTRRFSVAVEGQRT